MPSTLGIVASHVVPFSPLDLSPALWLDASDTSTITSSGSPAKVSQWNDKSGNGNNISQATSARQPAYSGTINSVTCVTFDASRLSRTTTPTIGRTATSVAVMSWPSQTTAFATFWQTTPDGGHGIFNNNSSTSDMWITSGDGSNWRSGLSRSAVSNSVIVFQSGASGYARRNGSQTGSGSNGTSGSATGIGLGSDRNDNAVTYSKFTLAELIIVNRALSATELADVETYLNSKWAVY